MFDDLGYGSGFGSWRVQQVCLTTLGMGMGLVPGEGSRFDDLGYGYGFGSWRGQQVCLMTLGMGLGLVPGEGSRFV